MKKNLLVVSLLSFLCCALLYEAVADTPTYDEPANMAASYAYVFQNDFRLYPDNPPLVKILAGLALLPIGKTINFPQELETYKNPAKFDLYAFGRDFLYKSGNNTRLIIILSRLPNIIITVSLSFLLYLFAGSLYGGSAGIVALLLFTADPNVRGHGHILAFDIPMTFIIVLILYVTYKFSSRRVLPLRRTQGKRLCNCGFTPSECEGPLLWGSPRHVTRLSVIQIVLISFLFALGFLTKFTFLFFAVIYFAGLFFLAIRKHSRPLFNLVFSLFFSTIFVSFLSIWAFGIFTNYNKSTLNYDQLPIIASANQALKDNLLWNTIRGLPIPYYYKAGLETMYTHNIVSQPAYLLGQVRAKNDWFFYFPASFLLKVPIPIQILIYYVIILLIKQAWFHIKPNNKQLTIINYFPFIIGALFFLCMMLFSHINNVFRYLFPSYVLFILGSSQIIFLRVLSLGSPSAFPPTNKPGPLHWGSPPSRHPQLAIGLLLLIYLLLTSFFSFPYDLSYTNEFTGIPPAGYKYLSDSEIDWGQDLERLAKWLRSNKKDGDVITLSYLGTADPMFYGIKYKPLQFADLASLKGIVAISVGNLTLGDWEARSSSDYKLGLIRAPLDSLRARKPDAVIGKSIFVYDFK